MGGVCAAVCAKQHAHVRYFPWPVAPVQLHSWEALLLPRRSPQCTQSSQTGVVREWGTLRIIVD